MKNYKSKTKNKKPSKYWLGTLGAGVLVIAPVAAIIYNKPQSDGNKAFASAKFQNANPSGRGTQADQTKQLITTSISQSNFSFSGENAKGVATFTPPTTGFENLEVFYTRDLGNPSLWTNKLPSALVNGDIFYARLAVKASASSNFEIAPNILAVKVQGLQIGIIDNPIDNIKNFYSPDGNPSNFPYTRLDNAMFMFTGLENMGGAYLNQTGITALSTPVVSGTGNDRRPIYNSYGLDYRLEVQFSHDGTNWTAHPHDLKNEEQIQVRIGLKPEFANLFRLNMAVKAGDPANIYAPVTISTRNFLANSQISPTELSGVTELKLSDVKFSGSNNSGSVLYDGYNANRYKDTLTYSRTYRFVSAWHELGIIEPNARGIYYSRRGTTEQYQYLPPLSPIHSLGKDYADGVKREIGTFLPFIVQKNVPIKEADITVNVLDGDVYREVPGNISQFLGSSSRHTSNLKLTFNVDGSIAKVIKDNNTSAPLQPIDYEDKKLFYIDNTHFNGSSDHKNGAYIYVDKNGNIGTALGTDNFSSQRDGGAITTVINAITYQDNSAWSKSINNDLTNGEFVSVSPTSESDGISNDFGNQNAVSVKVEGLTPKVDVNLPSLSENLFDINKDSGDLTIKDGSLLKTNLPAVNVLYSRDGLAFTNEAPKRLHNGDSLLVVQNAKPGNPQIKIADPKTLKINVSGLNKIVLPDSLDASSITVEGINNEATASLKQSVTLSSQVELEWKIGTNAWSTTAPINLKNNDSFLFRLKLKDEFKNEYELGKSDGYETSYTVSGLSQYFVLPDELSATDIVFGGDSSEYTLSLNKTLSPQVEVVYSKTSDGTFSTDKPEDVKNGDTIYAKLTVKDADKERYHLSEGKDAVVPVVVSGIAKQIISNVHWKQGETTFSFSGKTGDSHVTINNTNIPFLVKVNYFYSEDGSHSNLKETDSPTFFKNGYFYEAKLAIIDRQAYAYELDPSISGAIQGIVSGLEKEKIEGSFKLEDFKISKNENNLISVTPPAIAENLAFEYGYPDAEGKVTTWTREIPTNVKDQKIKVRLVAKDDANYQLASASPEIQIYTENQIADKENSKLSGGAIAGIVVASLVGVALIGVGGFLVYKKFIKGK